MVLALVAVEVTLAVPSATAALTLPGKVGAGQPAGTTIVTIELAAKVAFGLRKSKRKLLPLLPGSAMAGFTCMLPAPAASVNVADAVSWEVSPVAVARNVAPLKSWEKTYQLVSNSPFASASTVHGSNDCWTGSVSATIMSTVSPGWKPVPWK